MAAQVRWWLVCGVGKIVAASWRLNVILRPLPLPVLGPNKSSQPPLQDCALHFLWKCPDRWYAFLYNQNFAIRFKWNKALFWGNDPEFILMTKNTFRWHIIFLCLVPFCKKSCFLRQAVKIAVKVASFWVQG